MAPQYGHDCELSCAYADARDSCGVAENYGRRARRVLSGSSQGTRLARKPRHPRRNGRTGSSMYSVRGDVRWSRGRMWHWHTVGQAVKSLRHPGR